MTFNDDSANLILKQHFDWIYFHFQFEFFFQFSTFWLITIFTNLAHCFNELFFTHIDYFLNYLSSGSITSPGKILGPKISDRTRKQLIVVTCILYIPMIFIRMNQRISEKKL